MKGSTCAKDATMAGDPCDCRISGPDEIIADHRHLWLAGEDLTEGPESFSKNSAPWCFGFCPTVAFRVISARRLRLFSNRGAKPRDHTLSPRRSDRDCNRHRRIRPRACAEHDRAGCAQCPVVDCTTVPDARGAGDLASERSRDAGVEFRPEASANSYRRMVVHGAGASRRSLALAIGGVAGRILRRLCTRCEPIRRHGDRSRAVRQRHRGGFGRKERSDCHPCRGRRSRCVVLAPDASFFERGLHRTRERAVHAA
jgi:hypothetical protein